MKKSFLLILASLFAIFALAGCAEESKNDTPAADTVPADLAGTYEVKFFGSQVTNAKSDSPTFASSADAVYVSNDCTSAQALYPNIVNVAGSLKNQCTESANLLDGKVVITVENGNLNITSRMQMEGGALTMSPADKYQYTIYNQASSLSGKGVKGWNYDAANNTPSADSKEYPESPFTISQLDNDSIRIDLTLVGKSVSVSAGIGDLQLSGTVDAKTTIILEKVSDNTTALENNIQAEFTQSNTDTENPDTENPDTENPGTETPDTENPEEPTTPPTVVPITFEQVQTLMGLTGSQEILFFYTDGAGSMPLSNDCSKLEFYSITTPTNTNCTPVTMNGYGNINFNMSTFNLTAKLQMTNAMLAYSSNNQYSYMELTPNVMFQISSQTFFSGDSNSAYSRDLSAENTANVESYKIELLSDNTIKVTFVTSVTSPMPLTTNVVFIMKKIETLPEGYDLDQNKLFPAPQISGEITEINTASDSETGEQTGSTETI